MVKSKSLAASSRTERQAQRGSKKEPVDIASRLEQYGEDFLASFNEDEGAVKRANRATLESAALQEATDDTENDQDMWKELLGAEFKLNKTSTQSNDKEAGGRKVMVVDASVYGMPTNKELQTPKERRLFLSGKVADLDKDGKAVDQTYRKRRVREPSLMDSIAKEVDELGASTLVGKEKKKHQEMMLVRLGAAPSKKQRLNLPEHKQRQKSLEKKKDIIRTQEGAMGWRGKSQAVSTTTKKTHNKPRDRGLNVAAMAGTYSKGTLHINPKLLKSSHGKKR